MATRYIVNDVDAAIEFYSGLLGFHLKQQAGAAFAIVEREDIALMLTGPAASAQRPMPDGSRPTPGGWNRIVVNVEDIAATVDAMRSAGAEFRNDIMSGKFGQTILAEDPSGNPVELVQRPRG
jgi:predicted enzyme related to lactoylglutathione lyase